MSDQYFHFTLGPVQSFVAQARRTRDFWAGSFLLSWLSAVAMRAVEKQGGEIIFPTVKPDYLNWLEHNGTGEPPQQGCVPNRFKGGLAKVPQDFKPEQITASINQAWSALAEQVWEQDLKQSQPKTREIWERQVNHFWEISWALSTDKTESNLLDRRKNWRTYLPPQEAGVKCMMMDGWQELSGIETPNAQGLKLFWEDLRNSGPKTLPTDLREDEYLCAIAYIKRRFVHCFADFKTEMPGGWDLYGWKLKSSVPSVAYIAAAPWLAQVLTHAPEAELKAFHDAAKQLTGSYDEYQTRLDCIETALNQRQNCKLLWNSKSLDGNVFFDAALENKNLFPDQDQTKQVKAKLKALRQAISAIKIAAPSPFYAVLMMDGDSLGKHMSNTENQSLISEGLETFTSEVETIVKAHSGFLIYAGGDDVLALLPLEHALNCAKKLRDHYLHSFKDWPLINTTLSGAIEYAHIRMPLGKILSDAHQLLDDVAKDETGRDAIAVRVWKPGGQHLQWAMPWAKAIDETTGKVIIDSLAIDFQKDQQETPFSNSFFFNVEQRFAMFNDRNNQVFSTEDMIDIIAADYLSSGVNRTTDKDNKKSLQEAKQRIKPLLSQCYRYQRQPEDSAQPIKPLPGLNSKALQLIRFLAQKGVDRG